MRLLVYPEKDTKKDLCWNASLIIAELYLRCKLTKKELDNIISVSKQMADMETAQKED